MACTADAAATGGPAGPIPHADVFHNLMPGCAPLRVLSGTDKPQDTAEGEALARGWQPRLVATMSYGYRTVSVPGMPPRFTAPLGPPPERSHCRDISPVRLLWDLQNPNGSFNSEMVDVVINTTGSSYGALDDILRALPQEPLSVLIPSHLYVPLGLTALVATYCRKKMPDTQRHIGMSQEVCMVCGEGATDETEMGGEDRQAKISGTRCSVLWVDGW